MSSLLKVIERLGLVSLLLVYSGMAIAVIPPTSGAPVPEPGPIGLLTLGAVALLIARRFNRNR